MWGVGRSTEARFLKAAGTIVVLERTDGSRMTVSRSALSEADRTYLDEIGAVQNTTPQPAVEPEGPAWRDITHTFTDKNGEQAGIVLKNQRARSRDSHAVPIEIEYVCMTDFSNIRLVYACKQLIFNWEVNRDELRIDGGPADGQHRPAAGAVPVGKFVTIRQVVERDRMRVIVDGELRASWQADFSAVDSPISVFSSHGATVTVKSVRVREMRQ
jgi:hypothetical protein